MVVSGPRTRPSLPGFNVPCLGRLAGFSPILQPGSAVASARSCVIGEAVELSYRFDPIVVPEHSSADDNGGI
jgi:hypothetical protein